MLRVPLPVPAMLQISLRTVLERNRYVSYRDMQIKTWSAEHIPFPARETRFVVKEGMSRARAMEVVGCCSVVATSSRAW